MLVDGPSPAKVNAEMSNSESAAAVVVTTVASTLETVDDPIEIPAPPGMMPTPGPPPLPPPPGPLAIIEFHDPPDTKEGIEELCPVCGDKVSGYHYGLLTCESCKGFFKRTVQNKKVYNCVADGSCHIDKSQRKRCPYCRFQKCLDVGMKLEAVRADRMRGGRNKFGPMYKRDRARKLQMMRQKQIARAQCQGVVSNEVVPCGGSGGSQPFPSPGVSSPSIYSSDPHIKQELIQIPQLSSSTSSPDTPPSPLCSATQAVVTSMATAHYAPSAAASTVPSLSGSPIRGPAWSQHSVPAPPSPHHATVSNNSSGDSPRSPKNYHSYADAVPSPAIFVGNMKLPPLIRELLCTMPDEKDLQNQLICLLQSQTYNQCEVDSFELMCKVIDQSLFAQVDWARNSIFFKDLKVDDQMKLLQHSWSDMLVLDHVHQRLHNGLPEEITMANGQRFDLVTLALLGVPSMVDQLHHVASRLQELKFDHIDYICLKFMLLLNPGKGEVRTLSNTKLVHEAYEHTQQALLEYAVTAYPQVTDKFTHLLQVLPEIHVISERGEDFLLYRHLSGNAPPQTLLMEMLHAKKKIPTYQVLAICQE